MKEKCKSFGGSCGGGGSAEERGAASEVDGEGEVAQEELLCGRDIEDCMGELEAARTLSMMQ